MPTYVYQCPQCGQYETQQSIKDDALTTCKLCSSSVFRVPQSSAIKFTGKGFYVTDNPTAKRLT